MLAPSGVSLSIGLLPRTLRYAAKLFELRFYSLRQLLTSLWMNQVIQFEDRSSGNSISKDYSAIIASRGVEVGNHRLTDITVGPRRPQ
jgi:hypothetical protein